MIIDSFTIICSGIIIAFCIVSILCNPFLRRIKQKENDDDANGDDAPSVSILVIAHNNAEALDAHLPILLTQDYSPGYEVIVITEQGDIAAEGVIKHYGQCKNLRTTFVPSRSLFMSKRKLSVSLGVKAAINEWIILLDAESAPKSDTWLQTMAKNFKSDTDLVIGYSNYAEEAKQYYRFERLRTMCYLMHTAATGTAYRTNGTNIAFRRSMFIGDDGYRGNLQFINGEYDFIINKYAAPFRTRVEYKPDAVVREDVPTKKTWNNRNVYYLHLRHHLLRGGFQRFLFNLDMTMMHTNYILLIASGVFAAFTQRWILFSIALLALALTIILRTIVAGNAFKEFNEPMPKWRFVFFELSIVWHNLGNLIRYFQADKREFSTHKI